MLLPNDPFLYLHLRIYYYSVLMINNNTDFDSFMRNPPSPIIPDSLSHSNPFNPFSDRSFSISTFIVNDLAIAPSISFKELYNLFFINRIAICGVVDMHFSSKHMKFYSSFMSNYSGFYSVIALLVFARSSGGVSLFLYSSFAAHVQSYTSHFSRLLSVDLYFKGLLNYVFS